MSLEKINKTAYEVFSSMPEDEAKVLMSALVYDTLPSYIEDQSPYIQKSVNAWLAKRFDAYEQYLKRQYIERVQKNQDTSDLEETYEVLSKATFDNRTYEWTPERERFHPRDARGRFRDSPYKITKPTGPMKPIRNPEAAGIPDFAKTGAKNIRPERVAELQNAYLQVVNTLAAHEQMGLGDQKFSIRGTNGTKVYEGLNTDNVKAVFNEYAKTGNKPIEFKVITPQTTVGGVYFDALSSVRGVSQDGAMGIYEGGRDLPTNIQGFNKDWFNEAYALSDNEPRFRRLKAGADLVDSFVPQSAIKTKAALAGAKYVGELGPEGEKLIGPTARKLTYRSRGTEKKKIDPALLATDPSDRQRAILGYGQAVRGRDGKIRLQGDTGTIVSYFEDRLPSKNYWELQRKSGAVPPSEGVVIDSSGKIVSQSVGFKDDHYLPFNIKALAKLRGGEYVRTRSTGGPTTEDVYTALVAGATGFTVVSRSGSFTVEFDESFTGRRRYNDKAGKMVERYGKLLDAAGSGEVTLQDIDPDRYAEIVEAARENTTNREDYKRYLDKMLDEEKFKPKASTRMKEDLLVRARATLQEEIANGGTDFAQRYGELKRNALAQYAQTPAGMAAESPTRMLGEFVNREAQDRANQMVKAELANRSFRAMQLDGEGYHAALQALKEQYPYYIASIHYYPKGKEKDKGYVKPKFLRPDEVWEGYFDPSIKGKAPSTGLASQMVRSTHQAGEHGKIRASGTNYQNFKTSNPREQTVEQAEQKAAESTAPAPKATPSPATALDARERQVNALAAAYTAYLGSEIEQNGEMVAIPTSDALNDLGIDPFDVIGSIRNKAREDSTFLPSLQSELQSHLNTIGRYVAGGMRPNQRVGEWRNALNSYQRDVAPKVAIPAESNLGKLAMDNPDKVLDFPDLKTANEAELRESLQRPSVAEAFMSLQGQGPIIEAATERLKVLAEAYVRAERDKDAAISVSPEMDQIEREAASVARVKAIAVRREQLGGSEAFQSTSVNDDGDVVARIIGSGS